MENYDMFKPDALVRVGDAALRTLLASTPARRATPQAHLSTNTLAMTHSQPLTESDKAHAVGLMRVNHVGEVCAQALYAGQAFATNNVALKQVFTEAAAEEGDHLAWTKQRLDELGARPSLLNPLWYAGSFALGALASRLGDKLSLGFVVETERQVEAHLEGHLSSQAQALPQQDHASRAIVAQMQADEVAHAAHAQSLGATELPAPAKAAMKVMAKVMTTVAYRI
jgi:3-demethoxyubiquinol 3-hydroxylase